MICNMVLSLLEGVNLKSFNFSQNKRGKNHGKNYCTVPLHNYENGNFYFISRDGK